MNRNAVGCTDKSVYTQLSSLADSGDKDAFTKFGEEKLMSGECQSLDVGTAVYPDQTDTGFFSGTWCVRQRGETSCVWVDEHAVGH